MCMQLPVFFETSATAVGILLEFALHALLVLLGGVEELFSSLVAHFVFLLLFLLLLVLLLLILLLLVLLLLILLLLVLLLLVLFLLVLFVVLILVVATTTAIVLVFLQHEESHGEVVARLVVVGIAAQRALVEFDGLLEGGSRVALLHVHGSHSLSVPNIAHIVEVGCSALGVSGAK